MRPEVVDATTEVQSQVQDRGNQAYQGTRGIRVAQAGRDLGNQESVLRKWVNEFGFDLELRFAVCSWNWISGVSKRGTWLDAIHVAYCFERVLCWPSLCEAHDPAGR